MEKLNQIMKRGETFIKGRKQKGIFLYDYFA